jgi:hypothetical protein
MMVKSLLLWWIAMIACISNHFTPKPTLTCKFSVMGWQFGWNHLNWAIGGWIGMKQPKHGTLWKKGVEHV